MKIIPVKVENGILKIPNNVKVPEDAQPSILLTKKDEVDISFLEGNKSFSFWEDEPDLYSDEDIKERNTNDN